MTDLAALEQIVPKGAPRSKGEVTVAGRVERIEAAASGKVYWVHFEGTGGRGFVCAFFPGSLDRLRAAFPGDPSRPNLIGKDVRVTGKLERYYGQLEIIIRAPGQIRVVE